MRGAAQVRPKSIDRRLDGSLEAEDDAGGVAAERQEATAGLVADERSVFDELGEPLGCSDRALWSALQLHRHRGPRGRQGPLFGDLDSRLAAGVHRGPQRCVIRWSSADGGEHGIDEVVQFEPVATAPHDETTNAGEATEDLRGHGFSHRLTPRELIARQEQRRLAGNKDHQRAAVGVSIEVDHLALGEVVPSTGGMSKPVASTRSTART